MTAGDTPSTLRQWILEQARQRQPPTAIVQALLDHGWRKEQAVDAVLSVLHEHDVEAHEPDLPESTAVPEPMRRGAPLLLDGGDRQVPVLASLIHPRVIVLGAVLADAECDELVALARQRLSRSETFLLDEGVNLEHEGRTSEGMFFQRGENALCARIEARLAAVCRWPVENGEGLQVLRYGPGAEYQPHFDYFDPAKAGTQATLQRGGQRVASVVIYLNTPARGGETIFPDAGFEVAPVKGNAVFFSYDRPHPMTGSLHGGAPVLEGEKWVATKWLRLGPFT